MLDKQKYFEGGAVKRAAIAMDVKYRRLSHEELLELIGDSRVSREFFGNGYEGKLPKNQWDEAYLEKLSCAVVSESFNEGYLLHLEEVAAEIAAQGDKKKASHILAGIMIPAAIAFAMAVLALMGRM